GDRRRARFNRQSALHRAAFVFLSAPCDSGVVKISDRMNKMNRIEEVPETYDFYGQIIGLAMKIHSTLGPGFLESVYQNALIWELRKGGLRSEAHKPISVTYYGEIVGQLTDDLMDNGPLL